MVDPVDMTTRVLFGYFPSPEAARYSRTVRLVRLAEERGLDLVGIQDHPYNAAFLDTWTLISSLAAVTERVHLFPDVASLPLRHPAMLAKAAASLDFMSGGRIELGLGAGAVWDAIAAMGGPRRDPGEAFTAVREAIDIMRLMWAGERAIRYEGEVYAVKGLHPGPAPAHRINIWVGAGGPRMLRLIGGAADGWLPSSGFFPLEKLPDMNARIDEAASAAGRDPGAVRRLYNVWGTITDGADTGPFEGPPERWVATLMDAIERGMEGFIFGPVDGDEEEQLRRFAQEVAPRVRELAGA